MLTLGATVATLAFLAGVVNPQSLPVPQLPVDAVSAPVPLPLNTPPLARPSGPKGPQPKGGAAGGPGDGCPIMANYRLSADKLQEYLNDSLPSKIEELVKCSDVNLCGFLGTVLSTACGIDIMSLLPLDAVSGLTNVLPLNMLDGVLGKDKGAKSASPAEGSDTAALPDTPMVPDALSGPLPLPLPGADSVLAAAKPVAQLTQDVTSKPKSIVGGLLKGTASTDPGKAAGMGALQNAATTDLVGGLLSSVGSSSGSGGQGGLDVSGLLMNLKVQKVTVQSMTYTMTDGGMEAQAEAIADVQSDGVVGVAINTVGFTVHVIVTITITSTHDSANNTCQLAVEMKAMEVTKVKLSLLETAMEAVPVSLPLSLDDVVLIALSVNLTEKAKASSCAIQLDDFDTGRNVTGEMCQYTIAKTKISADGLCISYCAKCTWNKIPVLMPGNFMPKSLTNDSVSLILSHKAVRKFVGQCVEPVRVKVDDVEARITDIFYTYPSAGTVKVSFTFGLTKGGQIYGIAHTVALYSHNCRTANGKLVADVVMQRPAQINTTPLDIMDEMPGLMSDVLNKAVTAITTCVSNWNLPPGVSSFPVPPSNITTLKTNDLHVGK